MSQIKSPGSRIVFLDEGYVTYRGYSLYHHRPLWWDVPPIRHDKGVTLGFIDGHADFYKWQDEKTITAGETGNPGGNQGINPDLIMMQRGTYGNLGYQPTN